MGRITQQQIRVFAMFASAFVLTGLAYSLTAMGDAILEATRANPDAQVRADGEQAAARLRKTAGDDRFFREIKNVDDVNTVMGTTVKTWMEPVSRHCS